MLLSRNASLVSACRLPRQVRYVQVSIKPASWSGRTDLQCTRTSSAREICKPCRRTSSVASSRSKGILPKNCYICLATAVHSDRCEADNGDYVKVQYAGTLEDGSEFDRSKDDEPLEYIIGAKNIIKGFDLAVKGLQVGESRQQAVLPKDGYGEYSEDMVVRFPTKDLPDDFRAQIHEGQRVRLGSGLEATVKGITMDTVTLDANAPLAGKTLNFHVKLLDLIKVDTLEKATFGCGCFWGPELRFARVPGVLKTEVGYSQGTVAKPSYEDVCSGLTGHNEVVKVTFDPKRVTYRELLDIFMKGHDPTQENGQGGDIGSQYRSGIYYHTPDQKAAAEQYLGAAQTAYKDPIATEIQSLEGYWPAEDYHQGYLAKGGRFGNAQSPQKGCTDPIRCYG